MSFFEFISKRFQAFFSGDEPGKAEDSESIYSDNREKIVAFGVAFLISLCLWFIVNLNRDFNVNIEVPIELANLPDDITVSSDIPESVQVNVTGEGWNIISVYSNPPTLLINAQNQDIDVSEQIRNQVNAFSDLNIIQVQPSQLIVETERKASIRVPVLNRVDVNYRERFDLLEGPYLLPDSVEISGAESRLDTINSWSTADVRINDVFTDLMREVPLQNPPKGLTVIPETVTLSADVTEFTEAEIQIPIRTRNLPSGTAVTYNPSSVTVQLDVPIGQYSQISDQRPFRAYVDFSVIEADTTGRVVPQVELTDESYTVRIRDFRPSTVSYFRIVPD